MWRDIFVYCHIVAPASSRDNPSQHFLACRDLTNLFGCIRQGTRLRRPEAEFVRIGKCKQWSIMVGCAARSHSHSNLITTTKAWFTPLRSANATRYEARQADQKCSLAKVKLMLGVVEATQASLMAFAMTPGPQKYVPTFVLSCSLVPGRY